MKGCSKLVAACSLMVQAAAAAALDPLPPSVTVVHNVNIAVRQAVNDIHIAAIVPTQLGQIGINPPGSIPTPANIEGHTKFLSVDGGTTKWIGSDPSNIAVKVTTTTKKNGATDVATITKGVSAIKVADGGLNILLSPAVKAKLEAIAKQVTPCAAKRNRDMRNRKRGPQCGLADYLQRVGADEELQDSFAHPLTDQVFDEIDEGYGSDDPAADHGWEGDGGHHAVNEDEGYFSDDGEGFFEGAEGAEGSAAGDTLETIVFSTGEEAAAVAAGLSASEVEAAGVWGGSTMTAGSFLAFLWKGLSDGKPLSNVNKIPKESIHKISKTKTKTKTTSTSKCSAATAAPPTCGKCKPTSVKVEGAKATGVVDWVCSEGSTKGCQCNPQTENRITFSDAKYGQAVLNAISALDKLPKEAQSFCPGDISSASSKFLVDKTAKTFCEDVMKNLDSDSGPTAYDIDGNKIPLLKMAKVAEGAKKRALQRRSPPVDIKDYKDYRFFLSYKHEKGTCLLPKEDLCKNAYQALVSSVCGSNHGSAGDRMFVNAVIDTGCGLFQWRVDAPPKESAPPNDSTPSPPAPPKPTLSSRNCHAAHNHYDIHAGVVDLWSSVGCRDRETMKQGDAVIYWHPIGLSDLNQNYRISWVDGCTATTEQSVETPIEGMSCGNLLRDNYYDCNNGGAGGSIDAGCLRYDMYVT